MNATERAARELARRLIAESQAIGGRLVHCTLSDGDLYCEVTNYLRYYCEEQDGFYHCNDSWSLQIEFEREPESAPAVQLTEYELEHETTYPCLPPDVWAR
jgi:hypothetical protein